MTFEAVTLSCEALPISSTAGTTTAPLMHRAAVMFIASDTPELSEPL